jgi:hypothetical protein
VSSEPPRVLAAQIIVHVPHGFAAAHRRHDDLGTARKARRRVRVNAAHADFQIARHHGLVDVERGTSGRLPHINTVAPTVVCADCDARRQRRAQFFADFVGGSRTVCAACDDDGDRVVGEAYLVQLRQDERQQLCRGCRARQVVNDDCRAFAPRSQFG